MAATLGTARFRIDVTPLDENGLPLPVDRVALGLVSLDLPINTTKGELAAIARLAIRQGLLAYL
jgi:hypothetical protein